MVTGHMSENTPYFYSAGTDLKYHGPKFLLSVQLLCDSQDSRGLSSSRRAIEEQMWKPILLYELLNCSAIIKL